MVESEEQSGAHRLRGTLWVCMQLALLVALAGMGSVVPRSAVAIFLSVTAVGLALWAVVAMRLSNLRIHPAPALHARLVRHGPYARMRHPMYLSLLLLTLGWLYDTPSGMRAVLWVALILVLVGKARHEEGLLMQRFPEYAAYRRETLGLFPRIGGRKAPAKEGN